jgi:serine/threonine protein kinase
MSSLQLPHAREALRNYRLIEQIDQEELATIYRASHLTLDRPVQIHLLRRHDWIAGSRFQLAARLAARLSHPHLVPVIDAGHDDTLGDYLVTPQLDAQPLSGMLQGGALTPLLTVRIASQIGAALDYLHRQQVFHRDVQPANIFVSAEGVAYLANLSLAAATDAPDLSSIDEADYLTPYSAPEQRFAQGEVGAALDIYSLGAVIYHMLSGEVPSLSTPTSPSLAGRDPSLVGADRVIARMMALHPGQRFATAAAAVTALRQSLRNQLDQLSSDMEESRWEECAEWLENPVETALGSTLDDGFKQFLSRTHRRVDELHRRDVIRRLLNRWSQGGYFRRRALGQLVTIEQIISYNVYFYELRTLYERRILAEPGSGSPGGREGPRTQDLWAIPVPASEPFTPVREQLVPIPEGKGRESCAACDGKGSLVCSVCRGSGLLERATRSAATPQQVAGDPPTTICAACQGTQKQRCPDCDGSGSLVRKQAFTWSRSVKLFENSDDIEDLPLLALRKRREPVFAGMIDPYEGRWRSVAPIAELLRAAIDEAGDHRRIIATELKIQGTTLTEMDVLLDEQPRRLYMVGFDKALIGDWSLLNPERVVLAILGVVLALIALLALIIV